MTPRARLVSYVFLVNAKRLLPDSSGVSYASSLELGLKCPALCVFISKGYHAQMDHDGLSIKPLPAPNAGATESERFDSAVRKMFTVLKTVVVKQESRQLATNRRKRAKA